MNDVTVVYYTSNQREDSKLTKAVRSHLLSQIGDVRLVSVSQKPIDFGENFCVGDIGISNYNLYFQLYTGVKEVKTKYMMCAEDDYFYCKEHLDFRHPGDDIIYYNVNRWSIDGRGIFFWRERTILALCIAPTEVILKTLKDRFDNHGPTSPGIHFFSEPGKYEGHLGIPRVAYKRFSTVDPCITFNQRRTLGGMRRIRPTDTVVEDLPPWGNAKELWKEYVG